MGGRQSQHTQEQTLRLFRVGLLHLRLLSTEGETHLNRVGVTLPDRQTEEARTHAAGTNRNSGRRCRTGDRPSERATAHMQQEFLTGKSGRTEGAREVPFARRPHGAPQLEIGGDKTKQSHRNECYTKRRFLQVCEPWSQVTLSNLYSPKGDKVSHGIWKSRLKTQSFVVSVSLGHFGLNLSRTQITCALAGRWSETALPGGWHASFLC